MTPCSCDSHRDPPVYGARMWIRIIRLLVEWRMVGYAHDVCDRNIGCLRPTAHLGECWPTENVK